MNKILSDAMAELTFRREEIDQAITALGKLCQETKAEAEERTGKIQIPGSDGQIHEGTLAAPIPARKAKPAAVGSPKGTLLEAVCAHMANMNAQGPRRFTSADMRQRLRESGWTTQGVSNIGTVLKRLVSRGQLTCTEEEIGMVYHIPAKGVAGQTEPAAAAPAKAAKPAEGHPWRGKHSGKPGEKEKAWAELKKEISVPRDAEAQD